LNRTVLPKWLAAAILIPALLSLLSLYRRNHVEAQNKATSFAVEYESIEGLAVAQGMSVEDAIRQLKPQGMNSIVLSEETIGELISEGRITITLVGSKDVKNLQPLYSLQFTDPADRARVWRGLEIRLHGLAGSLAPRAGRLSSDTGGNLPLPPVGINLIRSTAIGLNPQEAAMAKKEGLIVVARCSNPSGIDGKSVQETLDWANELGANVFLASGEQVLGRKDAIPITADKLKSLGMLYASAEFTKIGGDDEIVRRTPENVVRLHSAQVAELDKLSLPDAVERYAKAARERNMRILLIRPTTYGADQPLTTFGKFLGMIRDQIVHEGGALGAAKPFVEPGIPSWLPILIGISLMPLAWFTFGAFIPGKRPQQAIAVALGVLGLGCATHMGLHLTALLASLVFPVAAFLILDAMRPKEPLLGFVIVTLVSLAGGLCIVGMLNGLRYYVVADAFTGVKISIIVPILIVGLIFVQRLLDTKETLKSPILWGTAALGVTIAVVLMIMVARTGNDSEVGASSGEIFFRNYLDRVLPVRPRTKEFMIGHPLLIIGIGMLSHITRNPKQLTKLGGWTALCLMVGAMGQTDIVNTLTHLHIPVALSLLRIVLGAILGCIIGFGLWMVVKRLLPESIEEA